MHCSATTKKGGPCTIRADREYGGKPYCHVHDPAGEFQRNLRKKRGRASGQSRVSVVCDVCGCIEKWPADMFDWRGEAYARGWSIARGERPHPQRGTCYACRLRQDHHADHSQQNV